MIVLTAAPFSVSRLHLWRPFDRPRAPARSRDVGPDPRRARALHRGSCSARLARDVRVRRGDRARGARRGAEPGACRHRPDPCRRHPAARADRARVDADPPRPDQRAGRRGRAASCRRPPKPDGARHVRGAARPTPPSRAGDRRLLFCSRSTSSAASSRVTRSPTSRRGAAQRGPSPLRALAGRPAGRPPPALLDRAAPLAAPDRGGDAAVRPLLRRRRLPLVGLLPRLDRPRAVLRSAARAPHRRLARDPGPGRSRSPTRSGSAT